MSDFETLNLNPPLLKVLREANILAPTQLQKSIIPEVKKGVDVLIDAEQTGSLNLAYAIPLLGKIMDSDFTSRVIILTAGHEASFGIEKDIRRLARMTGVKILAVTAGIENTDAKFDYFKKDGDFPHILIGEPASIKHFIDGTDYDMSRVISLVAQMDESSDASVFERHTTQIARRAKKECQRILMTSGAGSPPYDLIDSFLRSPSIVYDVSRPKTRTDADADAGDEDAGDTGTPSGALPDARSDDDTDGAVMVEKEQEYGDDSVDHRLYLPLDKLEQDVFTQIIKSERRALNLVVVTSSERADELQGILKKQLGDTPVHTLHSIDASRPLPSTCVVLGDMGLALKEKQLQFNSIILQTLPRHGADYLHFIKMLKGEPGDRIVTIATGRDIGKIFDIKALYGVRMQEMLPPSPRQTQSDREMEIIMTLASSTPEPDKATMSLLRRVRTSPFEDRILAESLRRMVDKTGAEAAAIVRVSAPTPIPVPIAPAIDQPRADYPSRPSSMPSNRISQVKPKGHKNMVELKLNAGKDDGLEADTLIQWLQSRLAMRASEFGAINIMGTSGVMFIPPQRVDDTKRMLDGLKFGDKTLEVQVMPSRHRKR
ncbi:MAG: DEAD/DEAH box helicase [Pseudomonadota bacterium]